MKKSLLTLVGAFALLFISSAQAEVVNGTFNVTEKWTVLVDYKNFGPNGLTTKKTFTGTSSGTVVVNNGHYDIIDKVTAAIGSDVPWNQLASELKARTISQTGDTFSINGNIVFGEGLKPKPTFPFYTYQGVALLGFFAVPITVDQSDIIAVAVAPEFYHGAGSATGISGRGVFANEEIEITVTSQITMAVKPPETVLPVVKITSPANNAHLTTPNVTITGTATDNVGISYVSLTIENSSGTITTTTNIVPTGGNWSPGEKTLSAGANKVRAKARDVSGNFSAEVVYTIYYDKADQLTVNIISPSGTVTPNLNGSNLVIGRVYTMTARPAAGFAFAGWTGGITNLAAALKFTMAEDLVLNAAFTDVAAPTVAVTSHKPNQRVFEPDIVLAGTAKDNYRVERVAVLLNGEVAGDADGKTNWSKGLTLKAGPNTVQVYAEDWAGKRSKTNTMTITYVKTEVLTVNIAGGLGKIAPNLNGQRLEIGKKYTITAVPNPGFAFVNWLVNGSSSNKATISFSMQEGMHVNLNLRDSGKPKLVITAPKSNAVITNETTRVEGTASDNVGVEKVWYRVDGGSWTLADGKTNWNTIDIDSLGKHVVQVFAVDAAENSSPTNTITFNIPTYAGIYMGSYSSSDSAGPGVVGVIVNEDRQAYLLGGSTSFDGGSAISAQFSINPDGTFSFGEPGELVSGKVTGVTIAGTHPHGKFSLTRKADTGAAAAHAGYYHGVYHITTGETGAVEALVSADGQVLFSASMDNSDNEGGGGRGTIVGTTFSANAGGAPIKGTINSDHIITATFRTDEGTGSLEMMLTEAPFTGFAGAAPDQLPNSPLDPLGQSSGSATTQLGGGGAPPPPLVGQSLAHDENSHGVLTAVSETTLSGVVSTTVSLVERPLIVITEVGDSFTIGFATEPGRTYTVEVSEDLSNWSILTSFTAESNGYEVSDPNGGAARFYRVIVR